MIWACKPTPFSDNTRRIVSFAQKIIMQNAALREIKIKMKRHTITNFLLSMIEDPQTSRKINK